MICVGKLTKGHNSIKEGGVTVLVLCTLSVYALYWSQVLFLYLKRFQITDSNIRVNARVIAIYKGALFS